MSGLTLGEDYPVLSIFAGAGRPSVQVLTDDATPALYPPEVFDTVDPSIPTNWEAHVVGGRINVCPGRWAVAGFWVSFYDDDESARDIYEEELAIILENLPEWMRRLPRKPAWPLLKRDIEIAMDYGQFTIQVVGQPDPDDLRLRDEALASPPSSGDERTVLVLNPHQNNFAMPIAIEVWNAAPIEDRDDWEQVSEHILAVEAKGIAVMSPTMDLVRCDVPPGNYVVETSGRGFVARGWPGSTTPNDKWRIRFWPHHGQSLKKPKIWAGPA